jgi:hypothetical protein
LFHFNAFFFFLFPALYLEATVDVDKLDTFLESMGIEITEKEFGDLTDTLTGTCECCE